MEPAVKLRLLLLGLIAQVLGVVGAAAIAATDVRLEDPELFPPVLAVALLLDAFNLHIAQRDSPGGRVFGWLGVLGSGLAAGSAAVLDYGDPERLGWLWGGLLIVGGVVAAAGLSELKRPPPARGVSSPPPVGEDDLPESVDRNTVPVMLDNVRLLLADEEARSQSLNGRGTGLAGFSGLIVSLLASLGSDLLPASELGKEQRSVGVVLFGSALVMLTLAVVTVLFGVLRTRSISTISMGEVELYVTRRFAAKSPAWVQGRTMATLIRALGTERRQNNARAVWLNRAVSCVAVAVLLVAAAALTIVV